MIECPVCKSTICKNFISLNSPVLQYPVKKEEKLSMPDYMQKNVRLSYNYCNRCGFVFMEETPDIKKAVNNVYLNYYNNITPIQSGTGCSGSDAFLRIFREIIPCHESFLEIGCFDGYLLRELKNMGKKILGVEPSSKGSDLAKENGIEIINDFFPSGKLESKKFDFIFSRNLIEHINDPALFLREQLKLLSKSGIIAFETPNFEWYLERGVDAAFHIQHCSFLTKRYVNYLKASLDIAHIYLVQQEYRSTYILSRDPVKGFESLNRSEEDAINDTELYSFEKKIERRYEALEAILQKENSDGRDYAIWGSGTLTGGLLSNVLGLSDAKLIIDSDEGKRDLEYLTCNIPISSPSAVSDNSVDTIFICTQFVSEVVEKIVEMKWKSSSGKKIYSVFPEPVLIQI